MSTSIIPGPNVFRAVSGSLFSSPVNWSRGVVPTGSDVAMIADNCTIDISRTIGSLVVRAPFTASINTGLTLQVNDVIDVKGHLSCSGAPNIISAAKKNNINSFSPGSSTFTYSGSNQNVPGVTYNNLTITNIGTKTLIGHTTLNGALTVGGGTFELSTYNLTVTGTTTCNAGTLSKTGAGNVLFVGNISTTLFDFSGGNPTVEVRGGIIFNGNSFTFNTGTGTWTFSTNNQSLVRATSVEGTISFNGDVIISGVITLTTDTQTVGRLVMVINKSINGNNALSKLLNKQTIYINNSLYPVPMTTGILDITTFTNIFGYTFNGNYTIPYTTLIGLYVGGTGTKTLSGTTTLSSILTIAAGGTLELSIYNLSVTGVSTITGTLLKSGAGNVLFIGNVLVGTAINFSGGNPTIEFRGGISNQSNSPLDTNFGTGLITFTTNNQSLNNGVTPSVGFTFNNDILISGAITLQTSRTGIGGYSGIFNGTINGNNINSKFLMGTDAPTINYRNTTQPMATGILDTSTNANTWIYGNANQDIKGGTYRNLTLNGGGTKTLQGNVSVQNTYTLTAPATVNNNGFTLTNP